MRRRMVVALVDALGWELAAGHPDFAAGLPHRRRLETILGFSSGALPTIFTGRYQRTESEPTASEHPRSLFALLGPTHDIRTIGDFVAELVPLEYRRGIATPTMAASLASVLSDLSAVYLHVILPPRLGSLLPDVTNAWRDFQAAGPARRDQLPEKRLQFRELPRTCPLQDALQHRLQDIAQIVICHRQHRQIGKRRELARPIGHALFENLIRRIQRTGQGIERAGQRTDFVVILNWDCGGQIALDHFRYTCHQTGQRIDQHALETTGRRSTQTGCLPQAKTSI